MQTIMSEVLNNYRANFLLIAKSLGKLAVSLVHAKSFKHYLKF